MAYNLYCCRNQRDSLLKDSLKYGKTIALPITVRHMSVNLWCLLCGNSIKGNDQNKKTLYIFQRHAEENSLACDSLCHSWSQKSRLEHSSKDNWSQGIRWQNLWNYFMVPTSSPGNSMHLCTTKCDIFLKNHSGSS